MIEADVDAAIRAKVSCVATNAFLLVELLANVLEALPFQIADDVQGPFGGFGLCRAGCCLALAQEFVENVWAGVIRWVFAGRRRICRFLSKFLPGCAGSGRRLGRW